MLEASGWGAMGGAGGDGLTTRIKQLLADGFRVVVAADSKTEIESYAGSLGMSLSGSSVGISVGVIVDLDATNAFIGDGHR